jgi:hypothetical protein
MSITLKCAKHEIKLKTAPAEIKLIRGDNPINLSRGTTNLDLRSGNNNFKLETIPDGVNEIVIVPDRIDPQQFLLNTKENVFNLESEDKNLSLQVEEVVNKLSTSHNSITLQLDALLDQTPSVNRITHAICSPLEAVGDIVYRSGTKIVDYYQVRKTDIMIFDKMPAWGIVIKKISLTECDVQWFGFVKDIYTTLIPGKVYFIDYDSRPIPYPPALTSDHFVQKIGYAFDSSTLLLILDYNLILRHV